MQTKDRSQVRGLARIGGTLVAAMLTAVLVVALAGVGTAASEPSAQTAAKRKACKPAAINALPTKKAKRARRKDCRDKRLGRPENPRRQRYDGKRIPTKDSARCDILDRAVCLQPWPNDYFSVGASTATGRRINLNAASTPKNINGVGIDPTDYNRADGFSPGQLIVTKVPGLDNPQALAKTNPVGLDDLHAYTEANTPIVVINAATGQRHPIWAELDRRTSGSNVNVEIRPAVNFEEGQRYIVAMRGMKRSNGKLIRPSKVFRLYRDRLITRQKPIEKRRKKVESLIRTLKKSGIRRGNLYLAWDFTVASSNSLAGRVLAMRNDAFAQLGDTDLDNLAVEGTSPNFTITNVIYHTLCSNGAPACEGNENDSLFRTIDGTIEVPCYLSHPTAADECAPGSQFAFSGPNDLTPNRVGSATSDVPFRCIIPRSVDAGASIDTARSALFGHGLLGNRFVVDETDVGANQANFVNCAMNWAGFSSDDLTTGVGPALINLSNFPKLGDHVQQAFINFLYLGRAMKHDDGFVDDEAFQIDPDDPENPTSAAVDTDPVLDTSVLSYFGVSHGGIMGGSLTSLAPDYQRAVLNVPAMNHSTLLERSIQWDNYGDVFYSTHPKTIEHPLTLSMIQMLWDRAENNGYAHHMTSDPYPNTPPHTVLMQMAYGDHQVTNYAAEVMARTIGARVMTPALDPGRHWDSDPFLGIPAITSFPYLGSAMVYWDGGPLGFPGLLDDGTQKPPLINIPPRQGSGFGGDPHNYVLADAGARAQLSEFLQEAELNPCAGGNPCYDNGFTGNP